MRKTLLTLIVFAFGVMFSSPIYPITPQTDIVETRKSNIQTESNQAEAEKTRVEVSQKLHQLEYQREAKTLKNNALAQSSKVTTETANFSAATTERRFRLHVINRKHRINFANYYALLTERKILKFKPKLVKLWNQSELPF